MTGGETGDVLSLGNQIVEQIRPQIRPQTKSKKSCCAGKGIWPHAIAAGLEPLAEGAGGP